MLNLFLIIKASIWKLCDLMFEELLLKAILNDENNDKNKLSDYVK